MQTVGCLTKTNVGTRHFETTFNVHSDELIDLGDRPPTEPQPKVTDIVAIDHLSGETLTDKDILQLVEVTVENNVGKWHKEGLL